MKIKYRKETIEMIRATYPLRDDLIKMAENGEQLLERHLDELATDVITASDICEAFESSREESKRNLYDRAKCAQQKHIVWGMASEDIYNSFDPEQISEEKINPNE